MTQVPVATMTASDVLVLRSPAPPAEKTGWAGLGFPPNMAKATLARRPKWLKIRDRGEAGEALVA